MLPPRARRLAVLSNPMATETGRGLRAQILMALFVAVVLAFGMLEAVATRLGEHARVSERISAASASAALFAEVASSPGFDLPRFHRLADSMIGHGGVRGVEVVPRHGPALARGAPGAGREVIGRGESGVVVRLYVETDDGDGGRRHAEFLFLYVVLTGAAILLLTYVSLTLLVVRPIERLRRASEKLTRGQLTVSVDTSGPAELAALARSFNEMASQLRADRESLEQRVADLQQTTTNLRSAQDQVLRTEKLASVGRLSAGVAHEIGNPLAAILGMVELLESGDLPEDESHEFIRRIRTETERIHRIIRDLLDFASLGNDSVPTPDASADVASVVRDSIALVKPQRAFREIRVEVEAPPNLPRVAGDESRLAQVLLNLFLNAADAIDGRGTISVRVTTAESRLAIVVDDDGPGIDPGVLTTLFEPFVTTKPVGKGTGLGLAVCHTIAQRLGGSMTAENRPERGARFTLTLPIVDPTTKSENS